MVKTVLVAALKVSVVVHCGLAQMCASSVKSCGGG
jgi:hypothetical protein